MSQKRVEIYGSSISGNREIKKRQQYLEQLLPTLKIPYIFHDLASDDSAKAYFRKKNQGHNELPGLFSDGEYRGTWEEFEYAVEDDRVEEFFKFHQEGGEIDFDSITATDEEIQKAMADMGIDDNPTDMEASKVVAAAPKEEGVDRPDNIDIEAAQKQPLTDELETPRAEEPAQAILAAANATPISTPKVEKEQKPLLPSDVLAVAGPADQPAAAELTKIQDEGEDQTTPKLVQSAKMTTTSDPHDSADHSESESYVTADEHAETHADTQ